MERNLTMMTDLYQLTMMNSYYKLFDHNKKAVFDVFFRPASETNLCIAAGLEQVVDYILNLNFTDSDLKYLKSLNLFSDDFLTYLKNFKFTGDMYSVKEGSVVFPNEPILVIKSPLMEAQLVETAILNILNHQTLIATKASRMVHVAEGGVSEFGLRRAHGPDAGIYGARAAVIGGCIGTSNVYTGKEFNVPVKGTHSHSFVMSFDSEYEAFMAYAKMYPDSCLLLVDTYDTLKSGVPNAIKVFDWLKANGHKPIGIRLDSGDLAYLSKKAREMLDKAGHTDAVIFASCDLDEYVITDLKSQGAKIDMWGIGTRLITSTSMPSLGGVYKMAAIEKDGKMCPKIKISDNPNKMTNPGEKTFYRLYDNKTGKALADLITLKDEKIDSSKPLTIFDPNNTWKRTTLVDFTAKEMLLPIIKDGELTEKLPDLKDICKHEKEELDTFWEEYKRINRPQIYKVDLSEKLYDLKQELITNNGGI